MSGPNQGMDRWVRCRSCVVTDVQDKVEFANGLYNNEEQISAAHLMFSAIADGWYLARLKAPNGQIMGLFSPATNANHITTCCPAIIGGLMPSRRTNSLHQAGFDRQETCSRNCDRSADIPFGPLHRARSGREIVVPTQVIARVTGSRKKQLRLVNTLTEGSVLVSADISELVIRMSERPRSAREIAKFLEAFGLDEEKYLGSAKLMMVLGIYQVVECKKDIAAGRTERRPKRRDDQLQERRVYKIGSLIAGDDHRSGSRYQAGDDSAARTMTGTP